VGRGEEWGPNHVVEGRAAPLVKCRGRQREGKEFRKSRRTQWVDGQHRSGETRAAKEPGVRSGPIKRGTCPKSEGRLGDPERGWAER